MRYVDQAGFYQDWFLILVFCFVLVIRFYVRVTGYPQIGSDKLHVAHMPWGGLMMLATHQEYLVNAMQGLA